METSELYPLPSEADLKRTYVNKDIRNVPAPAAIIDAAVVKRNCDLMLETARKLKVRFRAHVKTHKTTEISKLQVGEDATEVRLVASTVAEIENLVPWLSKCVEEGKNVNVLYGLPVTASAVPRLAAVTRKLGKGTVGLFVDHAAHVDLLQEVDEDTWPGEIPIWINIDVGYHREGVAAGSAELVEIVSSFKFAPRVRLVGLYTHMGHSYGVSSPEEAVEYLAREMDGLMVGARAIVKHLKARKILHETSSGLVLSIGATPTTTAAQNIFHGDESAQLIRKTIDYFSHPIILELHAGVYPVMDLQQIATHARPEYSHYDPECSLLSYKDLGLRIMVEVASLYLDRTEEPEALIAAGSIVLGREPCKSYSGWGVVTPWPAELGEVSFYDPEGSSTGWMVGRVSQEHGILTWKGPRDQMRALEIGQRLMIWPNHACMAGLSFGFYFVVDSSTSNPNRIRDVWIRWRGW